MSDAADLADAYWSYHGGSAHMWNIDRGDVEQIAVWEDLSPSGVELDRYDSGRGRPLTVVDRGLSAGAGDEG